MTKGKARKKKKCFIIMPFSSTKSCDEEKWKDIFEHIIKPAVEECRLGYKCERSLPERENIIKSILRALAEADVVIADLTDNNPNVFYELGVRHALTNRTILIAQGPEHIPFDLSPYPTVFYGESPAKIAEFKSNIKKKLKDVSKNPERSDNPVADFLKDRQTAKDSKNQQIQEKTKPATPVRPTMIMPTMVPSKEVDIKRLSDPKYEASPLVVCPRCRIQVKRNNLGEFLCSNCNLRLCPKGHIFDGKICPYCGWEDPNYNLWLTLRHASLKPAPPSAAPPGYRICPNCGTMIQSSIKGCPTCGFLFAD
jgi:hypothetical protein